MRKPLKIGTRPSPLALKQTEEIKARLPNISMETIAIRTRGDMDKISGLSSMEGSDFFTREIEDALLNSEIDAAVHSAKDLEDRIPDGLTIAAVTPSLSQFECLVSTGGFLLKDLPSGARVGTSSRNRREAVKRFRPDLEVGDIRGDIEERLRQLDDGRFDAVIVAHAALIRLGLESRIAEIIPKDIMRPHPFQGSLAIEVRSEDKAMLKLFGALDGRRPGEA